jgi:hypothetical protein
MVFDPYAKN